MYVYKNILETNLNATEQKAKQRSLQDTQYKQKIYYCI
jgi:hypothetical protein